MDAPRNLTVFAIVGAVAVTALLSACADTESLGDAPTETGSTLGAQADGAAIYAKRCAVCHDDDGSGARGPALGDGRMLTRYDDVEDEISVVRRGLGEMPAFRERLADEEIAAVVEYTRTQLVSED